MGSVLETTTFSSHQSATILVASRLLQVVLFRFKYIFYCICMFFLVASVLKYLYACSSVYFTFSTIAMPLLLSHD